MLVCIILIVNSVLFQFGSYARETSLHLNKACRGGTRTAAKSKMEHFVIIVNGFQHFVIIVNGFQPLTIITKYSILDLAAVLDPPLASVENTVGFSTSILHTKK